MGQTAYQLGILGQTNLNISLPQQWKINLKAETRFAFGEGVWGNEFTGNQEYLLTDLSVNISDKIGVRSKLGGGYLARFKEGEIIHRISQFYSTVTKFEGLKIGHRVLTDQTFTPGEDAVIRLRYRFSPEIPLQGLDSDAREFYLKINNEYLGIFEANSAVLEARLVPILGFKIRDKNKIESGIDFRLKDIGSGTFKTQGWLYLAWHYSI